MAKQSGGAGRGGRSRGEWEDVVRRFEQSGLSRRRFCAEAAIAVSSLDYWRGKLRREHPSAVPGFMELPSIPVDSGWDVELELGGGVVLRLRRA